MKSVVLYGYDDEKCSLSREDGNGTDFSNQVLQWFLDSHKNWLSNTNMSTNIHSLKLPVNGNYNKTIEKKTKLAQIANFM